MSDDTTDVDEFADDDAQDQGGDPDSAPDVTPKDPSAIPPDQGDSGDLR